MPIEVKKVPITIMVEEDVLEFHQNIAQKRGITVEERFYQLILKHSPIFNRNTIEEKQEALKRFGAEKVPSVSLEEIKESIQKLYTKENEGE